MENDERANDVVMRICRTQNEALINRVLTHEEEEERKMT